MKIVSTPNAPSAIGPYSQAIVANGFVFTSGQIALTKEGDFVDGDVKTQAIQVLTNLEAVLDSCGSGLDKVVKTTMFLADMNDFAVANEVYASFFKEHKPARSTIAVKTLPKGALVEVEATALVN